MKILVNWKAHLERTLKLGWRYREKKERKNEKGKGGKKKGKRKGKEKEKNKRKSKVIKFEGVLIHKAIMNVKEK